MVLICWMPDPMPNSTPPRSTTGKLCPNRETASIPHARHANPTTSV